MRGDIHRLRAPRNVRGGEQRGARFAVILQSDDLLLSTVLVAPTTSRSAPPRSFRPTILVEQEQTRVLVEQTVAVALERLGEVVGHVTHAELEDIDASLRLALQLD